MGEDLRILFMEAYRTWIEATTFSARESAWIEYTQARDLWLGKGTAYSIWENKDKDSDNGAKEHN